MVEGSSFLGAEAERVGGVECCDAGVGPVQSVEAVSCDGDAGGGASPSWWRAVDQAGGLHVGQDVADALGSDKDRASERGLARPWLLAQGNEDAELVGGQPLRGEDVVEASTGEVGGLDESPCREVLRSWRVVLSVVRFVDGEARRTSRAVRRGWG